MLLLIDSAFSLSKVAEPASAKSSSSPTSPVMSDCVAWKDSSSISWTCRSRSFLSSKSLCLISSSSFLSNFAGRTFRGLGGGGGRWGRSGGPGLNVATRTGAWGSATVVSAAGVALVVFLAVVLPAVVFLAVFFTLFLAGAFRAVFLGAGVRAGVFFAVFLAAGFLAAVFLEVFAGFLAAVFLAAGFRADFLEDVFAEDDRLDVRLPADVFFSAGFLTVLRADVDFAPVFFAVVRLELFLAGFLAGLMAAGR